MGNDYIKAQNINIENQRNGFFLFFQNLKMQSSVSKLHFCFSLDRSKANTSHLEHVNFP